ncbi:MAG TPA: hypothetical protein VLJ39_08245 [Tepidisphaeraceae bacterium]|nr:hypothetical protein [Tepidisphaeraceae bacterium]
MAITHSPRHFHPLPVIGHPEEWYKKHIEQAEAAGESLARCSFKVGQYVTLALQPRRTWEEKAKHFHHALKHHCVPPHDADAETVAFCQKLHAVVVRYASQEALRLARDEHTGYSMRLEMGVTKDVLADEADIFFPRLLGHGGRPEFLSEEAYQQIKSLRDHWI